MIKRLTTLLVLLACVISIGFSTSASTEILSLNAGENLSHAVFASKTWPVEKTGEAFPPFFYGFDELEETPTELILKVRVVSYKSYLEYVDLLMASGAGANTFFKDYTPDECTYYANCREFSARVKYYSDKQMPAFNMEIVIDKPQTQE